MSLTPGTRLGSYEITGSIGAGGMGEVYRARDTKLQRDVAIKVLPELFASDPDRLARFEREAQSLAALNHPNIAQVFGVLEDPPALAMELVEGEDLSQRIARGAIPAEEALVIAAQIADALEAAHERGIVHRDLKPANIKLRDDGTVKVLDFGLAKVAVEAGFSRPSSGPAEAGPYQTMNSPTFASPAMTQMGVILGTAAYMAPEQAKGRAVDKRADIWAFGAVLFEMLTGSRPFAGEDITDTIASIVKDEPEWRLLPANLPPSIGLLLRRCLQKDPRKRLRDIGDARLVIEDAIAGRDVVETPPTTQARGARRFAAPWMIAALATGLVVGAAATWGMMRGRPLASPAAPVVRFDVRPSPDILHVTNVALSSDARFFVYTGRTDGDAALHIHRFDSGMSAMLPGTAGARWPFLSPDGKWVGFFRAGKLQKVAIAGSDVLTLCDAAGGPGALWHPDGRIIFAASWLTGLASVPQDGGKPRAVTTLDVAGGEKGHWWPALLPDGRILLTVFMAGAGLNDNRIAVLDAASGRHRVVLPGAKASWLPSGHLFFYRAGRYQIVPFDVAGTRTTGESTHVLEDATDLDPAGDWPQPVAISATGALAYVPGRYASRARVVWISTDGKLTPVALPVRSYVNVALSPDEEQIALATLDGGRLSLRIADLVRGSDTPLEAEGMNWDPGWHPDGRLSFTSMRKGDFDVFIKDPARSDRETPVVDDGADASPGAWTRDGRLVYDGSEPDGSYVLKLFDPRRPSEVQRVSSGEADGPASLSPDEKWVSFSAAPEGRVHVYVQRFPGPGPAVQVSARGGDNGQFRPDGRELFFRRGSQLVAVAWEERNGRFFTTAERVVATVPWALNNFSKPFSVAKDGRVIALVGADEQPPPRINVVLGWAQGLRAP